MRKKLRYERLKEKYSKDEISYCKNCCSMTHTIKNGSGIKHCGKCGNKKL
jgi:hypothetical protein